MMSNKFLYEKYHKNIKLQKKIISINDFTYKNTLKRIDKYIPSDGNVLDVGSATGTISFYLGSKGLNVDGIEISKHAIKYANLNKEAFSLQNVNFINSSIENYKTNKKYDLITCFEVLEHLEDDKKNLIQLANYMNKNSILTISVPSSNAPLYRLGILSSFDKEVGHLRRYSVESIKKRLIKHNFEIIELFRTEGILRSFLYTNKLGGLLLRLTKFAPINIIFSYVDSLTLALLPESQIIVICKKK